MNLCNGAVSDRVTRSRSKIDSPDPAGGPDGPEEPDPAAEELRLSKKRRGLTLQRARYGKALLSTGEVTGWRIFGITPIDHVHYILFIRTARIDHTNHLTPRPIIAHVQLLPKPTFKPQDSATTGGIPEATFNSQQLVTAVWETASPHMRAQLSKNFANPTKPTNEEILAVCQQAVDEFSGDIAYTVMVTKLFNEPRSELETLDSGGVYPAARLLDKLLYQDLGQGWFLLYHPMVPIGGTIEMYGGREELYSWCLYVARGQPDSKHCIDVDSTPDVMVSA
ncbi:hypothetical protein D9757_012646 [Collybiopsis confluens]|uniref:Uncharacterized protein n=1 Tax=Collybiopsis confluens TaxID=2823264 RepID=A0A8H5D3Z2_9AGAR|nr:hypothetical protein D9757_012646 [Collybiopsis confluens]